MSRSLTIAVDGTHLPRDQRGAGRILRNVLKALRARTSVLAHRVVLMTRERHQLAGIQDELGWDFECSWAGSGLRSDVAFFPFGRMDWDPRCPRVLLVHDTSCLADEPGREADRERLARAVKAAHHVVTVSEFARRELVSGLNLPIGKVDVVHPAADPGFSPAGHDPRERVALLEDVTGGIPYLLYVGSTEPRKDLAGLLDAFTWLSGQIPHRLVLVCRKPRLSLTQRLIGRVCPITERVRALGNRVVFLGEIEQERLIGLYRHADLFVCPSLYESFAMPLLEALACASPVAAARSSSLPEIGGQAAVWFTPGEPVQMAQSILEALAGAEELRQAGPPQAVRFSWERSAQRLLTILEQKSGRRSLQTA
ncbi:MAG: glycosyltransferase family 1 protein [Candidatus Eremiobacterota bacterium]